MQGFHVEIIFSAIWFPWLQSRILSYDPWALLRLARAQDHGVRLLGVQALADQHHWTGQYNLTDINSVGTLHEIYSICFCLFCILSLISFTLMHLFHSVDAQYRMIAQALDHSTLVGLARSLSVDLRFFLPMPKLKPPQVGLVHLHGVSSRGVAMYYPHHSMLFIYPACLGNCSVLHSIPVSPIVINP